MWERDRGRMGRQEEEGEDWGEQGKSSCVGVCVSCDSQVSCGHVHRFK